MAQEKAPAFQFYVKDFLSDGNQGEMSAAEAGTYIRLICRCWSEKTIPDDVARVANLAGVTPAQMRKFWPAVRRCFKPHPTEPGRLVHPRLELEREKQAVHRQRQSDKGKASAVTRWQPDSNRTVTAVTPVGTLTGTTTEAAPQPKHNSPISDLRSPEKERTAAATHARSRRPIYQSDRFVVFDWQLEDLGRMLGPHTDEFDLHGFFDGLTQQSRRDGLVIPKGDTWAWLQAQVEAEARRRGLPMAGAAPQLGKQSTRLLTALTRLSDTA